jgi:16S rRNA (guanine966-N2)-methyltransferase
MRIVGGAWRGRPIAAPQGETTRPTTDRVREALFSALTARLGTDLGGAAVLDAFAGSGALGLEALSRGASAATFVEADRTALRTLSSNVAALDANARCTALAGDVFALAEGRLQGPFALILLDPPYTLEAARVAALLETLVRRDQIDDEALVVWEHASGRGTEWPCGFSVVSSKAYGTTAIEIAEFEQGAGE